MIDLRHRISWVAALVIALAVSSSGAALAQGGTIQIVDPWLRALPGHLPAAGYFTLANHGSTMVSLVGASSPACGKLMLHRTTTAGGTARMEMVKSVELPANGTVSFAPGGYHLMCIAPTADVVPGRKVPITLGFADGATLTAEFEVRTAAGN